MKTALLLIASTAFAADSKFEVKEISTKVAQQLKAADEKLEAAIAEEKRAQDALEAAKQAKDALAKQATASYSAYEGNCEPSLYADGMAVGYSKKFTRVEIRGGYALITRSQESCYGALGIGTLNTMSLSNGTLSIR